MASAQTPDPPHHIMSAPQSSRHVAGIVAPPPPTAPFLEPGETIFGRYPAILTDDGRVLVNTGDGYEQVDRLCPRSARWICIYRHGELLLVTPAFGRRRVRYEWRESYAPPRYAAPVYSAPVYPSGGGDPYYPDDANEGSAQELGVTGDVWYRRDFDRERDGARYGERSGYRYGDGYRDRDDYRDREVAVSCPPGSIATGGTPSCIDPLRAPVVNGYTPGPSIPFRGTVDGGSHRVTTKGRVIVRP